MPDEKNKDKEKKEIAAAASPTPDGRNAYVDGRYPPAAK